MLAKPYDALSTSEERLNWSVGELFASPVARISLLRCRPDTLACSCEKCAVDNQLVFVIRGGFIKHTHKSSMVANAAKAVLFSADQPYRTSHIEASGDDCIVLSFRDQTLPEEFSAAFACDAVGEAIRPTIFRDAVKMVAGLKAQSLCALQAEETSLALLDRVLPSYARRISLGPAAQILVRDIEAALTAAPGANWSLMVLSQRFKKSPFSITRSFAAIAGLPLHQYLLNLRLTIALARLAEGEVNLAGLAFDLGSSSHAHFSAAFKAALGESPSAFRRMTQSGRAGMVEDWRVRHN